MTERPIDPPRRDWKGYALAAGLVAVATVVGWPLHHRLGLADPNILMLYLLVVLWAATHCTRGAGVLASVLGVAAFDFFFVPPYYRLTVSDPQYLVTFGGMLVTSLVIGTLTHRVRVHAARARVAWERVEAEFLRNTLLSGVSHQLRTPLAGITGAASALIEAGDAAGAASRREMLETIYTESERMERLINNLLDMTRLESGGLVLNKDWSPVQEVVGSALNHMDRRLGGRRVTTRLPEDLPLVNVDGVAMEQVLVNVIDNAVEHAPGDGAIEITASAADHRVTLEVADRGPGLPAGAENRIFEKFYRGQPGTTQRGTGLGLAISRGIVEAHGGTMAAGNRQGGGAVFRITLPLEAAPPRVENLG